MLLVPESDIGKAGKYLMISFLFFSYFLCMFLKALFIGISFTLYICNPLIRKYAAILIPLILKNQEENEVGLETVQKRCLE